MYDEELDEQQDLLHKAISSLLINSQDSAQFGKESEYKLLSFLQVQRQLYVCREKIHQSLGRPKRG